MNDEEHCILEITSLYSLHPNKSYHHQKLIRIMRKTELNFRKRENLELKKMTANSEDFLCYGKT